MNQNNRIYSKESLHKAKELLELQLKKQLRENKLKRIIGEKVDAKKDAQLIDKALKGGAN